MTSTAIKQLRLLQIADSALPVGGAAHSYGLETLVESGLLTTAQLAAFLRDYVGEVCVLEAAFCRAAYHLAADRPQFENDWLALNARLSALKPARESRAASAMLGRRLLRLLLGLEAWTLVQQALEASSRAGTDVHYSAAFGLAGSSLELDEEATVLAYLQQSLAGLVSACQRLLPLGQSEAARILWDLKPTLAISAEHSREADVMESPPACFMPLVDSAGMRHTTLHTRLFMS